MGRRGVEPPRLVAGTGWGPPRSRGGEPVSEWRGGLSGDFVVLIGAHQGRSGEGPQSLDLCVLVTGVLALQVTYHRGDLRALGGASLGTAPGGGAV
mmetsp:Transcript_23627/g.46423  ORF Transcript_23627/g.46423 Transcript_23627/m.46423 type:complete len:96 (+) Transcript_23627:621-908(+)